MTKEDQILEILNEHTKLLNVCIETLNEHSRILNEHSKTLDEHTLILTEHSIRINNLNEKFNALNEKLNALSEKVDSMHQTLTILDNDFNTKSNALFDGHSFHQYHIDKNDKDIKHLQKVTEEHSLRLISLESNFKDQSKQLEYLSASK